MFDKALFSLPGIKRVLVVLTVFAVFESLVILCMAWSLSSAITNLWSGDYLTDQVPWIALFLFSFVGLQTIKLFRDRMLDHYAYERSDALREELMRTIFSGGQDIVQKTGTGSTTTLLLEGVEQVVTYLRLVLSKMIRLFVIPAVVLIPVFILDWVSGLIMLALFPFIIIYMVILGLTAKEKATRQHKEFKMLANHFVDTLRGIDTLKFFGMSKQHGKSIFAVSERFRAATIKTLRIATLSSSVLDLFSTLAVAAVAIMLGLRLLDGTLILFPALTVLILAPEYFKAIREFASDYHASLDGRTALGSVLKMIADNENFGDNNTESFYTESFNTEGFTTEGFTTEGFNIKTQSKYIREPFSPCPPQLSVDKLSYSYDEFEALRDISFTVDGSRKVGIIGTSGAGKSTLIDVLGGFATASKGGIAVDGTELTEQTLASWQDQIAYLPQGPYIFHASLRENISFYSPDATDEEVDNAIHVVGLEELIDELPNGIDTKVGEGARALSGGQAQRVALARICLDRKRSVLLFDEPTAHLDIETELELKERMLPLMQEKLVFFATHRLHWMQDMDLILVMDAGKIVASGTLEDLQNTSSSFASLASRLGGGVT